MGDWRDGSAHLDAAQWESPHDPAYLAAQVEGGEGYDWYYASPADRDAQARTLIIDTAYGEDWVFRVKDIASWWSSPHHARPGGVRSASPTAYLPSAKPVRFMEIGCAAIDKGANAPNLFYDPKSSESGLPPYSAGTRDDAIQAALIAAFDTYWSEDPMVAGLSVWCWDARPFPAFPARSDVWSDGDNWARGHWLNGRAARSSLAAIIVDSALAAGFAIDVSAVIGDVHGYAIRGIQRVRDVIAPLAEAFAVRLVASEGGLVAANRETGAAVLVDQRQLLAAPDGGPQISRSRTLTDHALRGLTLDYIDAEAAFEPASVRVGDYAGADREAHVSLPLVMTAGEATALADALLARSREASRSATLSFSPLADVPAGAMLEMAGEVWRVGVVERNLGLQLELVPVTGLAGLADGEPAVVTGPAGLAARPDVIIADLAPLPGEAVDLRPVIAAFASPWRGPLEIEAGGNGVPLTRRASLNAPASIARLLTPFAPASAGRWLATRSL